MDTLSEEFNHFCSIGTLTEVKEFWRKYNQKIDIDIRDNNGYTPLFLHPSINNHFDIGVIKFLLEKGADI